MTPWEWVGLGLWCFLAFYGLVTLLEGFINLWGDGNEPYDGSEDSNG